MQGTGWGREAGSRGQRGEEAKEGEKSERAEAGGDGREERKDKGISSRATQRPGQSDRENRSPRETLHEAGKERRQEACWGHTHRGEPRSSPLNFLCRAASDWARKEPLLSTRLWKVASVSLMSLCSVSLEQQVYSWGQTLRCSPAQRRQQAQWEVIAAGAFHLPPFSLYCPSPHHPHTTTNPVPSTRAV